MTPQPLNLTVIVSSLTIGGAEQLLLELLKTIRRKRFKVHILFLRGAGLLETEIRELGYPMKTHIINARFDLLGVFKTARVLKALRTDVLLLINHLNTLFYGVWGAKLARVPACINWENETDKRYPFHRMTMLGRRFMHLGVDKVVGAAKGHSAYIARVERVPACKIITIYNGVNPAKFASRLSAVEAKKRLGIPAQSRVVSIIAVLRPDKAHEVFLKAARLVCDALPQTHFLIIGDGPQRDYLEQLTRDLALESKVHFLGFQRSLGDILAAVDVNTLSSKPEQETLSVAAIEAMSAGIPIICTDVGFMHEIVRTDETGYLVPVGDPQALAQKLIQVLGDPARLKAMGDQAKRFVERQLSVQIMTAAFEKIFIETYCRKRAGAQQC